MTFIVLLNNAQQEYHMKVVILFLYYIYPEFLKNLGPKGQAWLADLFTAVYSTGKIPKSWCEATVIFLLKHGILPNDATSCHPISLLLTTCNITERVLMAHLISIFEAILPKEKAGFRPG